jgi:hypothetical protein
MMADYGADKDKTFTPLHIIQSISGTLPDHYQIGTKAALLGDKVAGAQS